MQGFFETLQLSGTSSIELIAWSCVIGVVIACLIAIYEKRYIGKFVRALLDAQAHTPESAKSLSELGFTRGALIRMAMRGKSALSTVVFLQDEEIERDEDGEIIPKIRRDVDVKGGKFYIPEERKHHAFVRFDQRGTHFMALIIAVIAFAVIAALAIKFIPMVIEYFEEAFKTI